MSLPRSPTRRGALLTGAVCVFGMLALHAWQSTLSLPAAADRLAFVASLALLFFAPMMLNVVGIQHLSYKRQDSGSAQFRSSLAQVGVRLLCWLLGAGLAFAAFTALRQALPGS